MKSLKRLFRASIVILFTTVILFGCGSNPTDVLKDARLKLDNSITLGDALEKNKHLSDQTWKEFEDDMGRTIVEFTATSDIACVSEDSCAFLKKYGIYTDVKIQFTIGEDDKFEITYIGTAYNASDELKQMFDEQKQKEYFGYVSQAGSDMFKAIYANKPIPISIGAYMYIRDGETSYLRTSEVEANRKRGMAKLKPYVNDVFELYGEQLTVYAKKYSRITVRILRRDENSAVYMIFSEYNTAGGYINIGSSDGRYACTLESTYKRKEGVTSVLGYIPDECPDMVIKRNRDMSISITDMGCDLCGLNGSLEGDYSFEVEIRFFTNGSYTYPYEARFADGSGVQPTEEKDWWKQ